jgi:prophage regulatory protein
MKNQIADILKLPDTGYLRQSQLIPDILPFSAATLWRMVKAGKFPKPVKLSERITAWQVADVRTWLNNIHIATTNG